jgi:N-methylhydantoinase B
VSVDPITLEVVRNRLEGIVEEMGLTMLQTAHSSIFYDSKDYSVALFTPSGELVSMGQYIPHHQGGMYAALTAILAIYPAETMNAGDVYLINDSYLGGTHTQDFNVFAPIFGGGRLVMFAGSIAHQIDIGGMTAGGYCPQATSIYQEGMRFPGVKLIDKGEMRDDLLRTLLRNVRLPYQQKGDLLAQLAALKVATDRVPQLVDAYGADTFAEIVRAILDITEARVRAEIAQLPDGVYRAVDFIDHDGHTPRLYRFELAMTVRGSELELDFTGTDDQAPGFINASLANTRAACLAALLLFLDPEIPRNHGFFRPLSITVPEGTVLNPRLPGPVSGSTTECGGRVYDLVLRALSQADPAHGLGTWSMMWLGIFLSGIQHRQTGHDLIHCVMDGLGTGGGARATGDGWPASSIAASNCLIPNVEIEEETAPIRYVRRELKTDSGGAGTYRGGLALETEFIVEDDCVLTVLGSRKEYPAPGIFGGCAGAPTYIAMVTPAGTEELPQKVTDLVVKAGTRIIMRACGGGGYGDPMQRDRDAVADDLRLGFISPEAATQIYADQASARESE